MNRDETESFLRKVAEACGIDFEVVEFDIFKAVVVGGIQRVWNPLTSDSDALDVAARLEIGISWQLGAVEVSAPEGPLVYVHSEQTDDDIVAAARLAICRCAASMPPAGREVVDG